MESAFELFPVHKHADRWTQAASTTDACPGKDTLDQKCTCPDVMYATKVRIKTAESVSRVYCGCCNLRIVY